MNDFRTLYGKKIDNVIDYISNYLIENDGVDLLIGSDSQSYGQTTIYGVVLALYKEGKGAHVVCRRIKEKKEKCLHDRLIKEVWLSVELALYLIENKLPAPKYIDIDLNPDPKYKSNAVLREAIGLIEGLGFKARCKHSGAAITYSANHLVRI